MDRQRTLKRLDAWKALVIAVFSVPEQQWHREQPHPVASEEGQDAEWSAPLTTVSSWSRGGRKMILTAFQFQVLATVWLAGACVWPPFPLLQPVTLMPSAKSLFLWQVLLGHVRRFQRCLWMASCCHRKLNFDFNIWIGGEGGRPGAKKPPDPELLIFEK